MKAPLKKILQVSFFFTLTALLLWWSFKDIGLKALWLGLQEVNFWLVGLGVCAGMLSYVVRAQRWRLLLQPLGYNPSLLQTYNAVIVGYLANFVFPRLGEVLRCVSLNRTNQVPLDKLVGTVFLERTIDLLCLLLLTVLTFFLRLDSFGRFVSTQVLSKISWDKMHASPIFFVVLFLILTLTLVCLIKRKTLLSHTLVRKMWGFLQGIGQGFKSFLRLQRRWEFFIHSLLLWTLYWLMGWLVLLAVPGTAHLGPVDGLVVMLLGSFGIVAPTSGGLGAYHAIMKYGLPILFGVSEVQALLYATVSHESQMLFIVLLGLVAYVQVFLLKRKPSVAPH